MPRRLFLAISLIVLCGCNNTSSNAPSSSPPQGTLASNPTLLPVKVAGKWGYADGNGKLIVNPQFDWADPFEGGKARICLGRHGCNVFEILVEDPDARWGFIDAAGKIAISPRYTFATRFSEGLAAVCTGDCANRAKRQRAYGYVDGDGKVVIPLQFGEANLFKESLAAVCVGDCIFDPAGTWNGKWGFINHSGNFVVNPQYDSVDDFTPNGFARVTVGREEEAKIGYIDKTGKIIWPPSN